MRSLILLQLVFGFLLGSPAQDEGSVPRGNTDQGQFIFNDRGCYACHGYEGHGGVAGARLAPDPIPFQVFSRYVRDPTGQMPPYTRTVLSDTGTGRRLCLFVVDTSSPSCGEHSDTGRLGLAELEQPTGIGTTDLNAVCFRNGGLIEPVRGLDGFLERIVDGEKNSIGSDL